MKILFLDFDGVINIDGKTSTSAVKNLNELLSKDRTLKIVVSSSWRHNGLSFVKDMLKMAGIDESRVLGITDLVKGSDRGHHIERWIDNNKPQAFVIFDDKDDMDKVIDRLVKINPFIGITHGDVKKALDILKKTV